jgi:hypothetical protein
MDNKQINQTTSPRKDAIEEKEVNKTVTAMINDNSNPPVVEEKPQEQKLQPQMEIPYTSTKTIFTLEYDVQPKQLLNDDHSCQPIPSQLAQEQPIMTNVSNINASPAISPSKSAINNKLLLSSLKGKPQSKQQQTLHSNGINRVSSSQKSIPISKNDDVASMTQAHDNNDNNGTMVPVVVPPRDTVNVARRVSSLSLDLNKDGICVADSNAVSLSTIIYPVEESAMAKPLSIFEKTDNSAAQSTSTTTTKTTTTTTNNNNNNNNNSSDDIAVASSSSSSPSSPSTKTNNSTNSLCSTSPYTKMKTVAEFSNNNSNITASFITTNTNTCTKVAAATIDNENLTKSSPPSAVSPKKKTKASSIGIINNTCSTDLVESDSATTTSTKKENNNNGMVILTSTDKKNMNGEEEIILKKKLTEQGSSITRTRRPQSENVEGEDSEEVSTPTSESNDNNALLRQLKRLRSFNVPGGSEAYGTSLPKRTKKAPQRLRQDNANFSSEENKNIKHMSVAHSTTTSTTTSTSSSSTSKSSRKRRIEKHMPVAPPPPPPPPTTTTTNSTPSTEKSSRKRRIEKLSQEAKGTASTTLPGRRRCMRCISNGATTSQAIECPGGKGRSGKGACKFFLQDDTRVVVPHSIAHRRRCMLCIKNGAPTSQAIECPGGKGQSGKGVCKFFSQEVKCVVAPVSVAHHRRCMLCIKNGAPTSQSIEYPGGKGQSGKGVCKFFSQEVKSVVNKDKVDSSSSLPQRRPRRCRRCVDKGTSSCQAASCMGSIGSYGSKSCEYFEENGTIRKEFKDRMNHKKSENKKEEGESILASPSLASTKHKTKLGKGRWTVEEHKRFLQAFDLFGTDWTKVAAMVKTRAVNKVQSYAHNSAFGHTLSNWSVNDYEHFLKKGPESWNLANNDHIINKLRLKEHKKDVVSTHASASCSTFTSSFSHATSSGEGGKESTTKATYSREAFHETIQHTAVQPTENIAESKQETTPRSNLDFNPNKKINVSKTPAEMNGTEGKSSDSVGNAHSCESGNSSRSTSKSDTKMTTEVNGTEDGKPSDSVGNAPGCETGNSTRSTSKPTTSDPIQKVFDPKKVTENDDSQECNSCGVPSLLNENGRILEKKGADHIDNVIADQNVAQICPATNNNENDVVGDSNSNAKVVVECQMCKLRREGRGRKIAHDAFCRHSRLYTGPDKYICGTYKMKKPAVSGTLKKKKLAASSSSSSAKSSTMIDTEALRKSTKYQPGDSKYLYAVRKLASFNEPPENEKHDTEIEVTAGGRIHPKRRRITCSFYEPRIMPDNKLKINQEEEQSVEDDDTENDNDDGDDDIHNNNPNNRRRKSTAMKSTKPKTECKACLFGSSYKMGHCVSCPRSRYYDPTATPASNYTEHQKNKKRGRAEVQLLRATATTTTGSDDDNFDSGNETDPTSNKRKKKKNNNNYDMSSSKKRKKSSSSKASSSISSSSDRRRNNNSFTVSQDTTRRIVTNALIRFQFQDRNHKIRKDHP